jgi:hypothetical protein
MTHSVRRISLLILAATYLSGSQVAGGAVTGVAKLHALAQTKFGHLSDEELTLFRAAAMGQIALFAESAAPLPADRIAWLCTDREAVALVTRQGIWLRGGRIDGELILSNAQIPFPLTFVGTTFSKGIALQHAHLPMLVAERTVTQEVHADGVRVEAGFLFRNGSEARGEVRLLGATIGGNLDFSGTKFTGKGPVAIGGDRLVVGGDVLLREGFSANGEVRLLGAWIRGNLDCGGGTIVNPNRPTLYADRVRVEGSTMLNVGFSSVGEARFLGAWVGGSLDCNGGRFCNHGNTALFLDSVSIGRNLFMSSRFRAAGLINLRGASIGGVLNMRAFDSPEEASIDLRYARTRVLADAPSGWPRPGNLFLNGFTYEFFDDEASQSANDRIGWVRRQPPTSYYPQVYEALASCYGRMGRPEDATRVLIEKEKDPQLTKQFGILGTLGQQIYGLAVGYGYRPWRALGWSAIFVLFGTLVFHRAARGDVPHSVER